MGLALGVSQLKIVLWSENTTRNRLQAIRSYSYFDKPRTHTKARKKTSRIQILQFLILTRNNYYPVWISQLL
jgi:hypothetical protein